MARIVLAVKARALCTPASLSGERYGSRSGERAGELGEDRQVGVEGDPLDTAYAEREQRPLVLFGCKTAPNVALRRSAGLMGYSYRVAPSDHRIVLELHGSKAKVGIELDGLEGFIEHFRRALREFERSLSAHEEEVGRSGQPGTRTRRTTGFRLVEFQTGSGLATIEPSEVVEDGGQLLEQEPASLRNLLLLMDSIEEAKPLSPPVIQSLDGACKALGDEGHFGTRRPTEENAPFFVDHDTIQKLEAAVDPDPPARDVTVSGRLHLLEFEEPMRAEVRAADGVNWACVYDSELEPRVVALAKSNVRAHGTGRKTGPRSGTMQLRRIDRLPETEQTSLFTLETIPTRELQSEQGIAKPQGLAALQDSDWVDDEASREYLATILDQS